jgi:hypothetical protein
MIDVFDSCHNFILFYELNVIQMTKKAKKVTSGRNELLTPRHRQVQILKGIYHAPMNRSL